MAELQTVEEVIKELGGPGAISRLTGRRWPSYGSNWKAAGRFPPDTFLIITTELEKSGHTAPPMLWGIEAAQERAAS